MALKDTWQDLENAVQGVEGSGSDISADDINDIAHAVMGLEENAPSSNVPTKMSELENDSGYIKAENNSAVSIVANAEVATLKAIVAGMYHTYFEANGKTGDALVHAFQNANIAGLKVAITGRDEVAITGRDEVSINGLAVNIHNVSTPTADADAANKKYVDDAIPKNVSALENDANYLTPSFHYSGGDINLSAVGSFGISTQYGSVTIKNVATPTADTDVANKGYVDGLVGDIEAALDGIIALQNTLIGGETV